MTEHKIYSLIPAKQLDDILEALYQLTKLPIHLVDFHGEFLKSFGRPRYCTLLEETAFRKQECCRTLSECGNCARKQGEALLFTCHANMNLLAVPLSRRDELLASIIIGPFLTSPPDSALLADLIGKYAIPSDLLPEICDELYRIPNMSSDQSRHLGKLVSLLAKALLATESAPLPRDGEKRYPQPHIREALQFIAANYMRPITLEMVANHVHLSTNYFSTLFRREVGCSFRNHLCKVRVEESKSLLLHTEYSLTEVAIAVGFADQSYYCKVFKRIAGITPGLWRIANTQAH